MGRVGMWLACKPKPREHVAINTNKLLVQRRCEWKQFERDRRRRMRVGSSEIRDHRHAIAHFRRTFNFSWNEHTHTHTHTAASIDGDVLRRVRPNDNLTSMNPPPRLVAVSHTPLPQQGVASGFPSRQSSGHVQLHKVPCVCVCATPTGPTTHARTHTHTHTHTRTHIHAHPVARTSLPTIRVEALTSKAVTAPYTHTYTHIHTHTHTQRERPKHDYQDYQRLPRQYVSLSLSLSLCVCVCAYIEDVPILGADTLEIGETAVY